MLRIWSFAVALVAASSASAGERTVVLVVENMTCAACPITVGTAIKRVPGVKDVRVDFERKTAVVVFDDVKATVEKLAEASRLAGYPATRRE